MNAYFKFRLIGEIVVLSILAIAGITSLSIYLLDNRKKKDKRKETKK